MLISFIFRAFINLALISHVRALLMYCWTDTIVCINRVLVIVLGFCDAFYYRYKCKHLQRDQVINIFSLFNKCVETTTIKLWYILHVIESIWKIKEVKERGIDWYSKLNLAASDVYEKKIWRLITGVSNISIRLYLRHSLSSDFLISILLVAH